MSQQTITSEPIQFGVAQMTSGDRIAGAMPVAINVTVDAIGAVRRRPCLQTSALATDAVIDASGLDGLHYTNTQLLLATSVSATPTSNVYAVAAASSALLGTLERTTRPSFAETEALVAIAGSRRVYRVLLNPQGLDFLVTDMESDPASPSYKPDAPHAKTIVATSGRLVADNPEANGEVRYSATAYGSSTDGFELWGAGFDEAAGRYGFFFAEARPDELVALGENTNELFAFGKTSLQVFAFDTADASKNVVFLPVSTIEYGCGAAAGVIRDEQRFAWLDDSRRIVYSDGRTVEDISQPIKTTLDNLTSISDCFGYRVLNGPVDALVWSFPTDGITLAYQKGGGWAQWSSWDDTTNNWAPMLVSAAAYVPGTGATLVGTSTGRVAEYSGSASTDLGTRVPASVTTGFQAHGTDRRKRCIAMRLGIRRGESGRTDEPLASLEWRDDLGGWGDAIPVSLGATGDSEIVVDLRSLGVYRRREWRFSFHGTEDITLASAVEEFEVLDI